MADVDNKIGLKLCTTVIASTIDKYEVPAKDVVLGLSLQAWLDLSAVGTLAKLAKSEYRITREMRPACRALRGHIDVISRRLRTLMRVRGRYGFNHAKAG